MGDHTRAPAPDQRLIGEEDDDCTDTVTQSQMDNKLKVDGIVDPQTRGTLLNLHQV